MEKLKFVLRYFRFLLDSKNEHSIHSPFIFNLYTKVIQSEKEYYIFSEIEGIRKNLLKDHSYIEITDLGAGSKVSRENKRKVSEIVRHSEKPAQIAHILFKLIVFFKPSTIIDLGTSFGLTTMYLATASNKNKVYTFEGCPEILKKAKENFSHLNIKNIECIEGNINNTLSTFLPTLKSIDFAFFDANHRYIPTMDYFKTCLGKATEEAVFVFDDIHWSEEMEKAWDEIKEHPQVTLTIDMFYVGLVFFRKNQPKQHFTLRINKRE